MSKRTKSKEKNVRKQEKQKCNHFWLIEEANGPRSFGRCKYCGEKKEFLNAFPTFNPLKKNDALLKLPRLAEVPVEKTDNPGAAR